MLLCPNVFSLFLSVLEVCICFVYLNISDDNIEAVNISVTSKAFLHVESRYLICVLPTLEFNFKVLQKSENNLIVFWGKRVSILIILRWHNHSFLYPMTTQVSQERRSPHISTIFCCLSIILFVFFFLSALKVSFFNKSLIFIASYKALLLACFYILWSA